MNKFHVNGYERDIYICDLAYKPYNIHKNIIDFTLKFKLPPIILQMMNKKT